MSATLKPLTMQERAAYATGRLRTLVGTDDLKLLSAAVAEAAVEECERNPAFLARVRSIQGELFKLQVRQPRRRSNKPVHVELRPLPGITGVHIDPFGPFDPFAMCKLYGPEQMRVAMREYTMMTLKEGVAAVQQRHPNTRPKDGRKIDSLVNYILEHAANG